MVALFFKTIKNKLNVLRYRGKKTLGSKSILISQPKYNLSKKIFIGAWSPEKYAIAAPVHKIVHL